VVVVLERLPSVVVGLISMLPLLFASIAAAEPGQAAHITGVEHVTDRWDKVSVYSPPMDKVIVNDVFKAPKSGALVLFCFRESTAMTTLIRAVTLRRAPKAGSA
jgi:diacylglycerol O-acyltransferase / trehalose O-mycolyltransferase / mycolyltransferase Ag85